MTELVPKILLIEDEPHLAFSLKLNLEAEGFDVIHRSTGPSAVQAFQECGPFHGVVLDVMLPELDGYGVAKAIRSKDAKVGILMLTARTGENDRLRGFEAGVDDYIAKPFHLKELIARVKRMTDRASLFSSPSTLSTECLTVGSLTLDCEQLSLVVGEAQHDVTKLEADFMKELMLNPGRVISREHLLEKVWGLSSSTETRTIDNFVVRLRKMIEIDPKAPRVLLSIRGKGYKLETNSPRDS